MFYFGVTLLAGGASGCVPILVGVAAFPITAVALNLTHPVVDGTASYMVWEKQESAQVKAICEANGAAPDSDCVSYEMQGKE